MKLTGRLEVNRPAEQCVLLRQRFLDRVADLVCFAHEDGRPQTAEDEADSDVIAEEGERQPRVHGQNQDAQGEVDLDISPERVQVVPLGADREFFLPGIDTRDVRMRYELDGGARSATERLRVRIEPRAITVCVPASR